MDHQMAAIFVVAKNELKIFFDLIRLLNGINFRRRHFFLPKSVDQIILVEYSWVIDTLKLRLDGIFSIMHRSQNHDDAVDKQ